MNLMNRLEAARGRTAPPPPVVAAAADPSPLPAEPAAPLPAPRPVKPVSRPAAPVAVAAPVDALGRLKDRVAKALFERMGARMSDPSLAEEQLRALVLRELDE
ncbi:CpaF family protein, partial [Blastococcus sp. SYSU DS0541]